MSELNNFLDSLGWPIEMSATTDEELSKEEEKLFDYINKIVDEVYLNSNCEVLKVNILLGYKGSKIRQEKKEEI